MRVFLGILVIVVALVPAVFIIRHTDPQILVLLALLVPTVAVSGVMSIVAWFARMTPRRSALIAGAFSFGSMLLLGAYGVVVVHGSRSNCDGFCFSQTGARVLILVLAISFGAFFALASAGVTAIAVSVTHRPPRPEGR